MRYISIDELKLITLAVDKIKNREFTPEFQAMVEKNIGDTMDEIVVDGIRTLKYSNALLIGVIPVEC